MWPFTPLYCDMYGDISWQEPHMLLSEKKLSRRNTKEVEAGIGFRVRIDYSPQAKTLRDEMTRDEVGSFQLRKSGHQLNYRKYHWTILRLILPFVLLEWLSFFLATITFFYFINLFTALSNYQVLSQQEVFFPRKGRK